MMMMMVMVMVTTMTFFSKDISCPGAISLADGQPRGGVIGNLVPWGNAPLGLAPIPFQIVRKLYDFVPFSISWYTLAKD